MSNIRRLLFAACIAVALCLASKTVLSQITVGAAHPGARSILDAHNCYPYFEWWHDRIDRALSTGAPLAIEQDLLWYRDAKTGQARSVVSHGAPATGAEPTLRDYFFERIRPVVEKALREGNRGDWPLITLNLDLKSEEPEHLAAIWDVLNDYRQWLTTALKTTDPQELQPLDVRPVLVLTGESQAQKAVFYDHVPNGVRLLVFGATETDTKDVAAAPQMLAPHPADNYHRWWNNSWRVVENAGQENADAWTPAKAARLAELVRYAHRQNLWIRFYTLDGASPAELSCRGWFRTYNFGSKKAVLERWKAARRTGVDYVATDQYEELAETLRER